MLEIGNDEFNAFMRSIGGDQIKAIAPRKRVCPSVRGRTAVQRTPEYVPGFNPGGITWNEVMRPITKDYGSPLVGYVTATRDDGSFCVESGDELPVVSFRPDPSTLKPHDIVIYAAATKESLAPNSTGTRHWTYGIGEIRSIHVGPIRSRIVVCTRPGQVACERLGIPQDRRSYRTTGTKTHWFAPLSAPFASDVRAEGHIVAVLEPSRRM